MAGTRARRRPIVFLAAAAMVTIVVLIAQGGASSNPNSGQSVQAYLDQVRPGIQQSAAEGSDLADVRSNAETLGRDAIDRRLDRLAAQVKATLESVESLTPPQTMKVAHAYLLATLGVRLKAVTEERPAMDAALTIQSSPDQGVETAVTQLTTVGQDLGLGDRAYQLFLSALPPGTQMPTADPWVSDQSEWDGVQLTAFVDLLRSSSSARPVHDIAVLAFQTDPAAVSIGTDGTQTIPASHDTSVSIVVQNVGNQPERSVWFYVVLTLADGRQEQLRDFASLAPGESRAIGPLRPLPTDAGMRGTLTVKVIPPPGDSDQRNDSLVVPVVFR